MANDFNTENLVNIKVVGMVPIAAVAAETQ